MELTLSGARPYGTRLLTPADLDALQALFVRAADYFVAVTGVGPRPDEARRAYVAGPPQKSVHDKRVIGIFSSEGQLVGVLDALTDWPAPGTWSMGALLLEPAHRGRGVGSAALAAYEGWAAERDATRARTALPASLGRGLAFLERRGYARGALPGVPPEALPPGIVALYKPLTRGKSGPS